MATPLFFRKSISQEQTISKRKFSKVKINVWLDLLLTIGFIVEMEEHFTGLAIHELLGLGFAVAFVLHIILHWDWIVSLTRKFFQKTLHESRLNYVLNALLFMDMALVTVSGVLISRTLGLGLALSNDVSDTLRKVHLIGSEAVLIIVALHVAMHWKWIKANGSKYLLGWLPIAKRQGVASRASKRLTALRSFALLVIIVAVMGGTLWWQGDLISPVENTRLLVNVSSDGNGFAMVGEAEAARDSAPEPSTIVETTAPETTIVEETPVVATMTMEEFVAALTAEGVDMDAVNATMTEGGRSLDNLLAVVNSGRVTVTDLALRLKGEAPTSINPVSAETAPSRYAIHWEELGSVVYDLWVMLAVTAALIVVARPVGWLVKRVKQA